MGTWGVKLTTDHWALSPTGRMLQSYLHFAMSSWRGALIKHWDNCALPFSRIMHVARQFSHPLLALLVIGHWGIGWLPLAHDLPPNCGVEVLLSELRQLVPTSRQMVCWASCKTQLSGNPYLVRTDGKRRRRFSQTGGGQAVIWPGGGGPSQPSGHVPKCFWLHCYRNEFVSFSSCSVFPCYSSVSCSWGLLTFNLVD
jgi:hypothetical protein